MTEAANAVGSVLEQLNDRVRELESRVFALEHRPEKQVQAEPVAIKVAPKASRPPETWQGFPSVELPSVVTVVGKAVLGIAGAYLLRAIAESGSVPKLAVVLVAIVYAALWMVWAVRSHGNRFATFTFAITSALILSPMLWESTVRFEFLPPAATGAILVAYFVLALGYSWRRGLQAIPAVATLATVITAIALMIATHQVMPLTLALLLIAVATEVAGCKGRSLTLRGVPAIAVDFAVWLLLYLMTSSDGVPEGYPVVAPATLMALSFALMAIYVGSIGIRAFWLRQRITIIDILQGAVAFVLGSYAAVILPMPLVAPALGVMFLLLAAGCYWGTLSRFAEHEQAHNRRVSASWAGLLFVAATLLLFPPLLQVAFLSMAAAVATVAYTRTSKLSLSFHASLFLAAAAVVSLFPKYVVNAMAGSVPSAPTLGVWIVAVSAALCYALGSRAAEERISRRALLVFPVAVLGSFLAALVVAVSVWIAAGRFELPASRLSVIRTIVSCALALSFGFLGFRWKRIELGWCAYAAVAFGTLKLFFEDLRIGNPASLVVSLLFYGLILILLPRLTRRAVAASPLPTKALETAGVR